MRHAVYFLTKLENVICITIISLYTFVLPNTYLQVNNAGTAQNTERVLTEDGLEYTMATNHYGHFLLTNLLLGV